MELIAKAKVKHNGKWYDPDSKISKVKKEDGERLISMGVAEEVEEDEETAKARAEAEAKAKAEEDEKAAIRAELESLGVTGVHPNTGLDKLREKLKEAKAEKTE